MQILLWDELKCGMRDIRPHLRLYEDGRHRAGSEARPDGAGYASLRGAANPGQERLREIAVRGMKSHGPGMNAVVHLLDTMHSLSGRHMEWVQETTLEIGIVEPFRDGNGKSRSNLPVISLGS